jgi:GNAT superfamily N-acetyltransferase
LSLSSSARDRGVRIERLLPDDWECYRSMRLAALTDAPTAFGSSLAHEVAMTEDVWRNRLAGRAQFVAIWRGAAVGMAGGAQDRENAAQAMLIGMWVEPEARRMGIGELLVEAVIEWATAAGFPVIKLWVTEGNDAAERLYARCGFARSSATERPDFANPEHAALFEMEHRIA